MRQAADYWFGQDALHWALIAYEDNGKSHIVKTRKRDNEHPEQAEHRLIIMMKKKHGLITAY